MLILCFSCNWSNCLKQDFFFFLPHKMEKVSEEEERKLEKKLEKIFWKITWRRVAKWKRKKKKVYFRSENELWVLCMAAEKQSSNWHVITVLLLYLSYRMEFSIFAVLIRIPKRIVRDLHYTFAMWLIALKLGSQRKVDAGFLLGSRLVLVFDNSFN